MLHLSVVGRGARPSRVYWASQGNFWNAKRVAPIAIIGRAQHSHCLHRISPGTGKDNIATSGELQVKAPSDLAGEVLRDVLRPALGDVPSGLQDFVERHEGRPRQLAWRLV
jgi:hypothetical protein